MTACSLTNPCQSKGTAEEQLRKTIGTNLERAHCAETACIGEVAAADAARLWATASAPMAASERGEMPSICAPMYALPDVRAYQAATVGEGSQCTSVSWYLVSADTGRVCASVEKGNASMVESIAKAVHSLLR
jgi:hypothetical protein